MFDLHLSTEQLALRRMVRDFANREIKPIALERDAERDFERRFPWDVVVKGSQLGFRTLNLSKEHGGGGADALTSCIVAEELAAGDIGVAVTFGQTAGLAHNYFDQAMSPEQRDRFLPDFLADDTYHLAIGLHEPDTDLGWDYFTDDVPDAGDKTRAAPDGRGNWVINGSKNFQTNGTICKLIAVRTRTAQGATALLLQPETTPGFTRRQIDAAGRRLASWAELYFDNCVVPAENLLGSPGNPPPLGFGPAGLPRWACMTVGVGRAAYEAALDYTKVRVQGGKPIVQHQAVGKKLADMAVEIEVARTLAWQAAHLVDHPEELNEGDLPAPTLGRMAVILASEVALNATVRASSLYGGAGLMRELPAQKYIRDATVYLHAAPRDVSALRLAEVLAGYERRPSPFSNQ